MFVKSRKYIFFLMRVGLGLCIFAYICTNIYTMLKTNTLISTDNKVKNDFKSECSLNGKNMNEVTESLWSKYIKASRENRKLRYEKQRRDRGEK